MRKENQPAQVIIEFIKDILARNRGKNLFYKEMEGLISLPEIPLEVRKNLKQLTIMQETELLDYMTNSALKEFTSLNQYYSIGNAARQELRQIYRDSLIELKSNEYPVLQSSHHQRLRDWLKKYNPFAVQLYPENQARIKAVACAEYSAEHQIELLGLDLCSIMEPVLDIGCGEHGNFIMHLRQQGIEAHGIDRFENNQNFIERADWLEYDYGTSKWGTIVSNLGFSNHFRHHHLRQDGNFREYAETYMRILKSLKPSGCFCYAPSLPFIEVYLDNSYKIESRELEALGFKTSTLTKLIASE